MPNEPGLLRGDVVVGVFARDHGKPRPAVVVQSDAFNQTHTSLLLCPITSEITGMSMARVKLPASTATGLQQESEVMVEKLGAVERRRIRQRIGQLTAAQMESVDAALRVWLDLPYMK